MPKIRVMPFIGQINREERLDSLRGCHAIHTQEVIRYFDGGDFTFHLNAAVKELLMADRVRSLSGGVQFIVRVEL